MNGDLLGFASSLFGGADDVLEASQYAGEFVQPSFELPLGWDLPVSAAAGPAPSAFSDFAASVGAGLSKVGGGLAREFTETPLKAFSQALGLGATGLGISSMLGTQKQLAEQTRALKKGQTTAQAAASPAIAVGTEQLQEARAGKLPAPMEAAVEQWKQQAKADMRAKYASMGLGQSSDLQHEESRIDLMGESMKAQLLQGQEGLALEALRTGVRAGTGVASTAQAEQSTLAALIQQANQALGRLSGAQA